MVQEILKAFILVFIAEMGDKTQILAMAFATKYPVKKVLAGIFIGIVLNHGLAVFLGSYVSKLIPIDLVQIIAGFAFLGFALWTLKYEEEEEEEEGQKIKFGPILTVAVAFFIGELGDKTQLSAITLAAGASYPLAILTGTVTAMMVTGGMGIFVGRKLGNKIPEFAIKVTAAAIFLVFGLSKLYENLPKEYLNPITITLFLGILFVVVFMMIRKLITKKKEGLESALVKTSRELYEFYHTVGKNVDNLCLGLDHCVKCEGKDCIVGHTKYLIKNGLNEHSDKEIEAFIEKEINKKYNKEEAMNSLRVTIEFIKDDPNNDLYKDIHNIRKNLERILFGVSLDKIENWNDYKKYFEGINRDLIRSVLS